MRTSLNPGTLTAAAFLFGSIVGAGTFALPAAAARSGFPTTLLWLILLSCAALLLHLMYAEIVLRTEGRHRLPGLAALYLGKLGARWASLEIFSLAAGILLIYVLLSGEFLHVLFPSLSETFWGVVAWGLLSALTVFGLSAVVRAELLMAFLLVCSGIFLSLFVIKKISLAALATSGEGSVLLPYGVLLFSLLGVHAVPAMRDFLGGNEQRLRTAVFFGTVGAALFYLIFTTAMVGAFGANLIEPQGLLNSLHNFSPVASWALALFGFLAVATSFLAIASYVVDALQLDRGVPRRYALGILPVPLFIFLLGARDFLFLVSLIGTLVGLLDGMLIVLMWVTVKRRGLSRNVIPPAISRIGAFLLAAIFIGGALAQLFSVLYYE